MKKLALALFCLAAASALSAQVAYSNRHFVELGLLLGLANHSGDISQPDIELSQSRPAIGIFARYHLSESFVLKGQLNAGRLYGDDKHSADRVPRQFRVKGPLYELSAVVEYAPLNFGFESTGSSQFYFFPYLFAGFGGAYVQPKVEYYGPPEGTATYIKMAFPEEGKARRSLLCTPVGVGMRVNINQRITVGFEGGWRPVYSDLLDGVSQNGNPEANDWYYFGGVTASYYLGRAWSASK